MNGLPAECLSSVQVCGSVSGFTKQDSPRWPRTGFYFKNRAFPPRHQQLVWACVTIVVVSSAKQRSEKKDVE